MNAGLSVNKETGELVLRTPYNPEVVELIKATVPHPYRTWDWVAKVWRISPEYGDTIRDALTAFGVKVTDRRPVNPLLPLLELSVIDFIVRVPVKESREEGEAVENFRKRQYELQG